MSKHTKRLRVDTGEQHAAVSYDPADSDSVRDAADLLRRRFGMKSAPQLVPPKRLSPWRRLVGLLRRHRDTSD